MRIININRGKGKVVA